MYNLYSILMFSCHYENVPFDVIYACVDSSAEPCSCQQVTWNEWMLAVNKSRNAGLYGKIKTFHIFDILCWFSIMFSCCMCCILEQCLNSNINNSIKFTFFHLKCPIFIICDVAWGMTPCVTCLRVKDDGCTRWRYCKK